MGDVLVGLGIGVIVCFLIAATLHYRRHPLAGWYVDPFMVSSFLVVGGVCLSLGYAGVAHFGLPVMVAVQSAVTLGIATGAYIVSISATNRPSVSSVLDPLTLCYIVSISATNRPSVSSVLDPLTLCLEELDYALALLLTRTIRASGEVSVTLGYLCQQEELAHKHAEELNAEQQYPVPALVQNEDILKTEVTCFLFCMFKFFQVVEQKKEHWMLLPRSLVNKLIRRVCDISMALAAPGEPFFYVSRAVQLAGASFVEDCASLITFVDMLQGVLPPQGAAQGAPQDAAQAQGLFQGGHGAAHSASQAHTVQPSSDQDVAKKKAGVSAQKRAVAGVQQKYLKEFSLVENAALDDQRLQRLVSLSAKVKDLLKCLHGNHNKRWFEALVFRSSH